MNDKATISTFQLFQMFPDAESARAVDKDGDRSDPTPAVVWVEKVIPTAPKTLAVS